MALTKVGPAGIGSTPGTGYVIGDSFLHSTGLDSTNAKFTGIVTAQTFRVLGNFQVDGTTTTLDTEITSVDKLEVAANNTTVGVAITQSGSGDILNLYDGSTEVFSVADGGNVSATGVVAIDSADGYALEVKNGNTQLVGLYKEDATGGYIYVRNSSGSSTISLSGNTGSINASGDLSIADKIIHTGDTNTAIRFPAADTITAETGGSERLRIDSSGRVLLSGATSSNTERLYVKGSSSTTSGIFIHNANGATNSSADLWFGHWTNSSTPSAYAARISALNKNVNTGVTDLLFHVYDGNNALERLRIDSSGRILVGTDTAPTAAVTSSALFVVEGYTGVPTGDALISLQRGQAPASISSGAQLGGINFGANDGSRYAQIHVNSDGAGGTNDYPGRLVFSTTSDGSATPSERLRITSAGNVGINSTAPTKKLDVQGHAVFGPSATRLHTYSDSGYSGIYNGSSLTSDESFYMGGGNLYFRADGGEVIRVLANGKVGINQSSPAHQLDVKISDNTTYTPGNFILNGVARLHNESTTTNSFASLVFRTASGDNAIGFVYPGSVNQADFVICNDGGTNGVERFRIAANGAATFTGEDFPYCKATLANKKLVIEEYSSYNSNSGIEIRKKLPNGNVHPAGYWLGDVVFKGWDGDQFIRGGLIECVAEGTPANNSMPAGLRFSTNSGGTGTSERLRITSAGKLLVSGQNALTSTPQSHSLQVAAQNDANAIAIFGRNGDDIGELSYYESDKSTKLGEIQYRPDHVNIRHRVGDIRFATGGTTERVRIESDGQFLHGVTSNSAGYNLVTAGSGYRSILLGSTSGATAALIIDGAANGDGSGSDYASIEHNTDGTMRYKNRQSSGSGGAGHIFYTTNSDTERLRITSAGRVGINVTSPSEHLHIAGAVRRDTPGSSNIKFLEFSFELPSGTTTTIATVTSPIQSSMGMAIFEYMALYDYAGNAFYSGIEMASFRRKSSNSNYEYVQNSSIHASGNNSNYQPNIFWQNGSNNTSDLMITTGNYVLIVGTIRITTSNVGLTRVIAI
tara:strand:- start:4832 stop:7939 length:3108 start_codon:yes stop_codon:yes gene_type:complete